MDIMQIVAAGFIGAVLSITVKPRAPEIAMMISAATSLLIFFMIAPKISAVFGVLSRVTDNASGTAAFAPVILKIIGVSYIAELGAQICADAGEGAIAAKIEMGAKVLIMVISAPVILTLLDLALNIA